VGLTSVKIGDSVAFIGSWAFQGCTGLTTLTIPNSVTLIGDYAFADCSGLTTTTIGDSVISIGDWSFSGCDGLTSVTIGSSVVTIGELSFRGSVNIKKLYCKCEIPPSVSDDCFSLENYVNATLFVPVESVESYRSVDPWSKFNTIKEFDPAGVEDIVGAVDEQHAVGYYNTQGIKAAEPWPGLNIVVYSDGSTRKMLGR